MQEATTVGVDHVVIRGTRIDHEALISPGILKSASALRESFAANRPFPHIVIDGLFSPTLLELVHDEFKRLSWRQWERYDSDDELKLGSATGAPLGSAAQLYFNTIHSRPFIRFIEHIASMSNLQPDVDLFGGGLHEIPDGGHFSPHIDFNRHPVTGLDNRLVLITYLNKNWQHAYGGALELWSAERNVKVVDVDPVFGRTIVFAQSPMTLHGHPVPVRAPDRRPRRSLAAYYYSNGVPNVAPAMEYHTTRVLASPASPKRKALLRGVKYFTPPVLVHLARTVAGYLVRR